MKKNLALRGITQLPRRIVLIVVYLLTFRWLRDIISVVRDLIGICRRGKYLHDHRRGRRRHCGPKCGVVRPAAYKRADPLIYSQAYLMEQGLAVTWDNPDIQLFENGVPVSSSALKPDTVYQVVATVYNNSTNAPAVGLPVEFAFQSFGVGAVLTGIGTTVVNLPVKGAPGHPALAKRDWRTPKEAGHYCLKVRLVWPDDANPKNNIGQENTNVVDAASPAVYTFPVRNDDAIRKAIRMVADAYAIPKKLSCKDRPPKGQLDRKYPELAGGQRTVPYLEEAADWTLARVRHSPAAFPVPQGWRVDISPSEFVLAPGDTQPVTVTITPPDDFRGQRPFNINALYGNALLGGVTLIVRKA